MLVGLVAFAALLRGPETARGGAVIGLFFGAGANLVALRFVPEVIVRFTPLPYVAALLAWALLSFAQGLSWALAGALAVAARRRAVPAFLAFGAGVYAALFMPGLFPWTPAGGLSPWPVTVQLAELVGERGVSFVVALGAGLAAEAIASRGRGRLVLGALSAAVAAVVVGYGALRMRAIDGERAAAAKVRVGLVQPGTPATVRWEARAAPAIRDKLNNLTKIAESRGVALTVWPEASFPYALSHGARLSPTGERAVLSTGVRGPVVVGLTLLRGAESSTNSALIAEPASGALPLTRLSAPYDKRHLLAFGETVPLADQIPWLRRTFARGTGLVPGDHSAPLEAGPVRAGILICYEDNLPEAGREAMTSGGTRPPNLLVNLTNDAWFAGSAEGELHLRLSVLRAVETRRDLARAVNLGPTSMVDAAGRVRARYDAPFPKVLDVEVALLERGRTPYTRFGDTPLALLVALAVLAHGWLAQRRRADATD
ncbi:MAG: apolipoprotein N-acyltransferase [Myxococcales bacterium]|nr:apolipoprotein N-acyltransferase [Myxococcales bacterium]